MMRGLVALIIFIVSCAVNGCVYRPRIATIHPHIATIHPHSEVTSPTFCLHSVDNEPVPIKGIRVYAHHPEKAYYRVWELMYVPGFSDTRRFSCITYGRPPPRYYENAPALPLIPGAWYSAWLYDIVDSVHWAELSFIIRSDSSGRPIRLEYNSPTHPDWRVHVITKP